MRLVSASRSGALVQPTTLIAGVRVAAWRPDGQAVRWYAPAMVVERRGRCCSGGGWSWGDAAAER